MYTAEDLRAEAENLGRVPMEASASYRRALNSLVRNTNELVLERDDLTRYFTGTDMSVVRDNHGNHGVFMASVFSLNCFGILSKTLPWVYRAYRARGFTEDYFPLVINSFMDGVKKFLPAGHRDEILSVYRWMLGRHREILALSRETGEQAPPLSPRFIQMKSEFLNGLLQGSTSACLSVAREACAGENGMEDLYLNIIQPAMYEIGLLWESNEITVAEEHLASAIVTRVISSVEVMLKPGSPVAEKGRVVVTTCSSEFHEIGAWMVADLFEKAGWQVRYLGANTPSADLVRLMTEFMPDILALSVTMSFNLNELQELIGAVRANPVLSSTGILVGGRVFRENPDLWKRVGADGYSYDISGVPEAVEKLHGAF